MLDGDDDGGIIDEGLTNKPATMDANTFRFSLMSRDSRIWFRSELTPAWRNSITDYEVANKFCILESMVEMVNTDAI